MLSSVLLITGAPVMLMSWPETALRDTGNFLLDYSFVTVLWAALKI